MTVRKLINTLESLEGLSDPRVLIEMSGADPGVRKVSNLEVEMFSFNKFGELVISLTGVAYILDESWDQAMERVSAQNVVSAEDGL